MDFFPTDLLLFIFEINLIMKYKCHWNNVIIRKYGKNTVRFALVPLDFLSFYLFVLSLVMELKNASYKNHWNYLVFCGQGKMMSDICPIKKCASLFHFYRLSLTLTVRLRNFHCESHWNTVIFFDLKKKVKFDYVLSNNVWFCISLAVCVQFC